MNKQLFGFLEYGQQIHNRPVELKRQNMNIQIRVKRDDSTGCNVQRNCKFSICTNFEYPIQLYIESHFI